MVEWNKGTGGGSGLETEFERWADDKDKFDKYGINIDEYDHTDIDNRPIILFNLYSKNKEPYLTVIRLWDNTIDNLLCAKYYPIHIGHEEVGMDEDVCSDNHSMNSAAASTSSKRWKKRKGGATESAIGLQDVMKSITSLCDSTKKTPVVTNTSSKRKKGIENMSLEELYQAIDQYKKQLKFLADMEMLSTDKKKEMVDKTKVIFAEIGKRTNSEVS